MDFDNKGKGFYAQQEIAIEEKSLKIKIYNFFYSILKDKKEFNLIALCILIILEMLQLISYAFDEPHSNLWKIKESNMNTISTIIGALRILPLMKYVNFNIYLVIFIFLIIIIFILYLFITMLILFDDSHSKLYTTSIYLTGMIINPLSVFLFTPIIELILLPLKCNDENKIDIVNNSLTCWTGLYYLYMVLGIIGCILLLICVFFLLTFYFSPFQYQSSTIKLTPSNDTILILSKFIFVLRYIFVKNEYLSILILLILSIFLFVNEYSDLTYNNYALILIMNIRNIAVFWTYFILLISKLCEKSDIDGLIYLLLFGYPVIIYCSIVQINKKESSLVSQTDNFHNINNYLNRTRFLIKLINSFLDSNKNMNNNHDSDNHKNEILLKGTIQIHNESCVNEECPLNKFIKNPGNQHIQKQCLLNYMTNYFDLGIKRFPQSSLLLIYYIQFNYSKRYNLNSVRTNLLTLRKMRKNYHEEFIIYCIEQEVKKMNNKISDNNNDSNEIELENDLMEQKYQRLKYLIENSTKLYGEFWGIFATNVTNNLNTLKLYNIGEKLNKYLNEINTLWDNDLKSKKIDLAHHGIIQLYSRFLKEILWNKKRTEDINKKLNDEHHHHETKKIDDDNFHGNNMDTILENQDFILFCSSNEKGKCSIIQCSNSIIHLFGFQKSEIIGKAIENLMPNIFIDGHMKMLEEHIKDANNGQNSQKDNFKSSEAKQIFITPKNKMGYIIPMNGKCIIYDDNDFSNTFIIKVKLEPRDTKSIYAFYLLTKNDFSVECISSSALHLGLTMDLLKKHLVKMDVLVRNENNIPINFFEKCNEFEDEPKKVTWIFPDIIYPKDDLKRNKDDDLENLVFQSKKKKFNLQINSFRYSNSVDILGYCFKFTELNQKKPREINENDFVPKTNNEIMFDILSLNYIRTILVEKKSGLRNLRDINENNENDSFNKMITYTKTKTKKVNKKSEENVILEENDDDEEEKKNEVILNKEKIDEMQAYDSYSIKDFIATLNFYGNDVSLEKHRPNREKYPVGKAQEPLIKIAISQFMEHIEKKIQSDPELSKKLKRGQGKDYEQNSPNNSVDSYGSKMSNNENNNNKMSEDMNREFTSDTSTSLSNIFNAKSVFYIKITSLITFLICCLLITLEFVLTYIHIDDIRKRINYMNNGYNLLSNMVYTKYFITEAVLTNKLGNYTCQNKSELSIPNYIYELKRELSKYREQFTDVFNSFSSATITFSKEYNKYVSNTQVVISTISNGNETNDIQTFSSAMNRIPTSVFYVSTITDQDYVISMDDRHSYELMKNLLNSYFITWRDVTKILVNDIKHHSKKSASSIVILAGGFVFSLLVFFIFWKLLVTFSADREKPINLFLTIKKKIFEELKNASESFSNKLLNKFFGNEDNEEEAQIDNQTNIQPSDINIIKFKAQNESKVSRNKDKLSIINYIKLICFFVICNAYMIFKFSFTYSNIHNMSKFTDVYDISHSTHTNIILSIDILKSFLFNNSIPILNQSNTFDQFLETFYDESDSLEKMILNTSDSDCFLDGVYKKKFYNYLYKDYNELVTNDISKYYITGIYDKFKPILMRLFEDLKYLSLQYLNYGKNEDRKNGSIVLDIINEERWIEINNITTIYVRYWFKDILNLMDSSLGDYVNTAILVHITIFIIIIVFVILAYLIIWKSYEKSLNIMLKRSFNLINLIPEEIKFMIVSKLNE